MQIEQKVGWSCHKILRLPEENVGLVSNSRCDIQRTRQPEVQGSEQEELCAKSRLFFQRWKMIG